MGNRETRRCWRCSVHLGNVTWATVIKTSTRGTRLKYLLVTHVRGTRFGTAVAVNRTQNSVYYTGTAISRGLNIRWGKRGLFRKQTKNVYPCTHPLPLVESRVPRKEYYILFTSCPAECCCDRHGRRTRKTEEPRTAYGHGCIRSQWR